MADIPSYMIKALIDQVHTINTLVNRSREFNGLENSGISYFQVIMIVTSTFLLLLAFATFTVITCCCKRKRRRTEIYRAMEENLILETETTMNTNQNS